EQVAVHRSGRGKGPVEQGGGAASGRRHLRHGRRCHLRRGALARRGFHPRVRQVQQEDARRPHGPQPAHRRGG
ncbi:MAG: hypothetical protein AVDCRST_MAG89-3317, partial [uncultured Gemmatimonadetes bacterium]